MPNPAAHVGAPRYTRPVDVPWRSRPLITLQTAAAIAGLSVASLYKLSSEGRLVFKKLAGRTLVDTASLIALVDGAEAWHPSSRTGVATRTRIDRARASRSR